MRNSIFFIAIGLFLFLTACRSSRQVVQETTHDSTTVEFREVEKVVKVPGDTISVTFQLPSTASRSGSGALIGDPVAEPVEAQKQVVETKRTKVTVELTSSGEIKATAITKDVNEKVTVQEKTIRTSSSSVTVVEKKESWLKRTFKGFAKTFKTVVITILILTGLFAWFRFSGSIKSFVNKFISKS